MLKWELPRCPYCGCKIDFINACAIKTNSVYKCKDCGNLSNIMYDKKINKISIICEFIALAMVIVFLLLDNSFALYGVLLVALVFLYFYIKSPFLIELVELSKTRNKSMWKKSKKE